MIEKLRGLFQKYVLTHSDGSPLPEGHKYIVLRFDGGEYQDEALAALSTFVERLMATNAVLASDIAKAIRPYMRSKDVLSCEQSSQAEGLVASWARMHQPEEFVEILSYLTGLVPKHKILEYLVSELAIARATVRAWEDKDICASHWEAGLI